MSQEIPLTKGYVAIVDDEDFERVAQYNWSASCKKHTIWDVRRPCPNSRKNIYLHRFILDVTDPKIQVDHRNHNGLDNRRSNLRVTGRAGNVHNTRKRVPPTSSRFKGVNWREQRQNGVHVSIANTSDTSHPRKMPPVLMIKRPRKFLGISHA